jgi:hypothetical protein
VSLVVVPLVPVVLDDEPPPEPPPQAASERTQATANAAKRNMRRPLIPAKNMRLGESVLPVPPT